MSCKTGGRSDLLLQRAIRGVGHCKFTGNKLATTFLDLFDWVDNGQKTAGDDFLDPASVAASDFGCQFSDAAGHFLAAPCP
jgi:hypothetical protein